MQFSSVVLIAAFASQLACGQGLDKTPPVVWTETANGVEAKLQLIAARNVVHFQAAPVDATAAAKIALLRPLFQKMLAEKGRQKEYTFTFGRYNEINSRMAEAAACLGKWNPKQPGTAVRDLLNEKHLFPELEKLFAELGYQVRVHQAEGIFMCRWSSVKMAPTTAGCKPSPNAQVPCGATLVFRVTSNQ